MNDNKSVEANVRRDTKVGSYWGLVNSLVQRGITSEEAWYLSDPAECMYYYNLGKKDKSFKIETLMTNVIKKMGWMKTMYDYVIRDHRIDYIEKNPIYKMFLCNDYDPGEVGTVLVRWTALVAPRNTLWISGKEETGARILANAISFSAPLIGRADIQHPTNPFHDCVNCHLIVWDGGHVMNQTVDICLKAFTGNAIKFNEDTADDNDTREMFRTPIVMYTNKAMGITLGNDGFLTCRYTQQLIDSMYHLHFTQPYDGGVITCSHVKDFLTWAADNRATATDRHDLRKNSSNTM